MVWIAVDVALVVLTLGLLGFAGLALWRQVTAFGRAAAAEAGRLSAVVAQVQSIGSPPPGSSSSPARHTSDTEAARSSPSAA